MSKRVRQSTYPCRPDDKQQSTTLVTILLTFIKNGLKSGSQPSIWDSARPFGPLASRMCKEFFFGVIVPAANVAAEPHWRDAHDSTEDLREMTLIGEAGRRT